MFRIFFGYRPIAAEEEEQTATSAGSYNMYQPPHEEPEPKRRKIKYIGPGEPRTFFVASTPKNKWIPSTIKAPSVLEEIERTGLILRQQSGAKFRQMLMADDEWLLLN